MLGSSSSCTSSMILSPLFFNNNKDFSNHLICFSHLISFNKGSTGELFFNISVNNAFLNSLVLNAAWKALSGLARLAWWFFKLLKLTNLPFTFSPFSSQKIYFPVLDKKNLFLFSGNFISGSEPAGSANKHNSILSGLMARVSKYRNSSDCKLVPEVTT